MYKLMLVDDEDTIRKRVIDSINWAEFGYEIVCEAENGHEALELFVTHMPDVVITDIKMPFMDGLELSERILRDYPFTKIIILTGFDEFEYAKKSVDLHVMRYVLKPISIKELIEILTDTKNIIDSEIEERRSLERLKEHYDQSFPLMRHKFLEGLVLGEFNQETINKWLMYYHVPLSGDYYTTCVVQVDDFYEDKMTKRSSEIELRKIALLDMVEEIQKQYPFGTFFLYKDYVVIILSMTAQSEQEFLKFVMSTMDKLKQGISRFLDFTVSMGIGYIVSGLAELKRSYDSALYAHDYKLLLGKNQILYINDLEPNQGDSLVFGEVEQIALRRLLKTGPVEEYKEYVTQLLNKTIANNYRKEDIQIYILEIMAQHFKIGKENESVTQPSGQKVTLQNVLDNLNQISYIQTVMINLGVYIIEAAQNRRSDTSKSLIMLAKDYIKDHFHDDQLSLESISEQLHYSPNYFSSIFKKETGSPFMKFLTDIRLEKAKELILTTDQKNIDIALEVGFSSANYFAFCFKKEFGISPSQYKKQGLGEE